MSKSQRLRITERGWNGYTGHFGGVEFKDGVSVEIVDPVNAARLGSIIQLQLIDTDQEAGSAAALQRVQNAAMEVASELVITETSETPAADSQASAADASPAPTYTRESLEKVADEHGIAGLRAVADPLGVKGRGIAELIDEILKAQDLK